MRRTSRLPFISILTSVLLPYGVVVADTPIMTMNQYWLFPLWTYLNDFGNWLGFGTIIPPFLPSFSIIPSITGLIWCVLGIYLARNLDQVYKDQIDAKIVWTRAVYLLIAQVLATIGLSVLVWNIWIILILPVPLHFLIILVLIYMHNEDRL